MSRIYEQGENILSDKYITGSLYVNRTHSYYDDIALFASSFTQQDIHFTYFSTTQCIL